MAVFKNTKEGETSHRSMQTSSISAVPNLQ